MNSMPQQNLNMNDLNHHLTRPARWPHLLGTCALLLGTLVPNAQAAGTALNVTATATGAEILNDGTLVAANHFGASPSDAGMAAPAPVTLANG